MVRTMLGSLVALGVMLGAGLPAASADTDDDRVRTITVTGHAEANAVPDVAVLSIGVETKAETPGKALAENAERMTAVMEKLKSADIAERDLQTSQLGIWPVFAEHRQNSEVVGYQASNQLSVTIRDIDRLGSLLDDAVADGANRVNGPTFSIADPEPLLIAAREAAVKDGIAKAERYAAAAGVKLGDVISIDESRSSPAVPRHMRAQAMEASTPIAAGETTIAADVTMIFAIK